MIDLPGAPGNSAGSPGTKPVAEIKSAADLARHQISQTIQAVVLEAKLTQEAGTHNKAGYEILLRANAAPGTAPPLTAGGNSSAATANLSTSNPITQITAQAINALRQGQTLLIKTTGEIPLPPGTQLLASVSANKGVVISRILPAQVAATLNQALRVLVPQQQSMSPLFQTLEQLVNNPGTPKLNNAVQALMATLLQLLPKLEQLKTAEQVRQAINNSGLFLENKILKSISQEPAANNKSNNPSPQSQPLSEGLKQLSSRVKDVVGLKASMAEKNVVDALQTAKPDLAKLVQGDLKQLLQQLQSKLEQVQSNPRPSPTGDPAKPLGNEAKGIPSASTSVLGNDAGNKAVEGKPAQVASLKTQADVTYRSPDRLPEGRTADNVRHEAASAVQRTANKIQSYTATQSTAPVTETATKSALETFILPPLPGNIPLQPQPRSRHSSGDMADALVSILLKQVKGAISRVTLHQLASQPRSQDPAAPQPLLSFELPILHQGQVQIFQFLIEEEESQSEQDDKQVGKRWVVQMAFDVEGLGPMLCQISMLGLSASVSFWAEWENTLEHTRNHFDYLQSVLTEMGLRVEKLQGHLGIPKSEQAVLQNQLVDIRT